MVENVYIVAAKRTPVCKALKGHFRSVRPDDMLAFTIKKTLSSISAINTNLIEDAIFGCAMPEGAQGMNIGRISTLLSGLPDSIPAMTINRLCCSGLESVALVANRISTGNIHCALAGGVESMSMIPMGGHNLSGNPNFFTNDSNISIAYGMGVTAEVVAKKYNISREEQDHFALNSHKKANYAIEKKLFKNEIIPYKVQLSKADEKNNRINEHFINVEIDEGPRLDTNIDKLLKLKPAFSENGTVTAGNSSQVSDGAACCLLVSETFLRENKLDPLARFVGYQVAGVPPEIMGIGPVKAIPKVLNHTGLKLDDIGWIELNEAFAAQSIAVINELGLNPDNVNPYGGAIALGHPLGATGTIRLATAINGAKIRHCKYAMVTMCVGTGMGAAGIIEVY